MWSGEAFFDDPVDEGIGNILACIHVGLCSLAERGTELDGFAKDVACGEVKQSQSLAQPIRLRAFTAGRRSEKNHTHTE